MKKSFILLLIALPILLFSCKSNSPDQPYGEKSGIITFKPMKLGGEITVKQVQYFTDYGKKEAREITISSNMGQDEIFQQSVEIRDGNIVYKYEIYNGSDSLMKPKRAYKQILTQKIMEQFNISNYTEEFKKLSNYKEEGSEKIIGLKCKKISLTTEDMHQPISIAHYKNIPIRTAIGDIVIEAEKAEFGVKIPAEKFTIPAGYKIIDAEQINNEHIEHDSTFLN